MNALYLIRQDDGKITFTEFVAVINNLSGTRNLKTQNVFRAAAEVDYFYEDDCTIIRLNEDEQLISISGVGKSSIHAVNEIQKRYAHPLRLFDMDYTFDVLLNDITNIEELRRKIDIPM